jgi:hypothetical protein
MPLTAYTRFRFAWGLIDFATDDEGPTYDSATTQAGISHAVFGRRAIMWWERWGGTVDPAQTHFDIVNVTSGAIDDTWTDTDFTQCETALDAFWTAVKSRFPDELHLRGYRWYRLGPGATPPEPAVRTVSRDVAGTSTSAPLPQQVGSTLSWRTGIRKRWGRSYLPSLNTSELGGDGNYLSGTVDALANAANTLIGALAANDFKLVVYSPTLERAYAVEHVVVDSIPDIQRRRRIHGSGYKATRP